jgi:hypothetical protein
MKKMGKKTKHSYKIAIFLSIFIFFELISLFGTGVAQTASEPEGTTFYNEFILPYSNNAKIIHKSEYDPTSAIFFMGGIYYPNQSLWVSAFDEPDGINDINGLWDRNIMIKGQILDIKSDTLKKDGFVYILCSMKNGSSNDLILYQIDKNSGEIIWNSTISGLNPKPNTKLIYNNEANHIAFVSPYINSTASIFMSIFNVYNSAGLEQCSLSTSTSESVFFTSGCYYPIQDQYIIGGIEYLNGAPHAMIWTYDGSGTLIMKNPWNPFNVGLNPILPFENIDYISTLIPMKENGKISNTEIYTITFAEYSQRIIIYGSYQNQTSKTYQYYLTQHSIVQNLILNESYTALKINASINYDLSLHLRKGTYLYEQPYETIFMSIQTGTGNWKFMQISTQNLQIVVDINFTESEWKPGLTLNAITYSESISIMAVGSRIKDTGTYLILREYEYNEYNPYYESMEPNMLTWSVIVLMWVIPLGFLRKKTKKGNTEPDVDLEEEQVIVKKNKRKGPTRKKR